MSLHVSWWAPTVSLSRRAWDACHCFAFPRDSSSKDPRNFSLSFSNHDVIYVGKEGFTFKCAKESGPKTSEDKGGVRCRLGASASDSYSHTPRLNGVS